MRIKGFIAISILFNLLLGVGYAWYRTQNQSAASNLAVETNLQTVSFQRVITKKGATRVIITNLPVNFSWRTVESEDFKQRTPRLVA